MRRVLRPGGKLLVLEFSRVAKPLEPAYDWYSFNILPWLGKKVANDEESYRYLAESIRMHPDQETLAGMLGAAGLSRVQYFNLTAGLFAFHEVVHLGYVSFRFAFFCASFMVSGCFGWWACHACFGFLELVCVHASFASGFFSRGVFMPRLFQVS